MLEAVLDRAHSDSPWGAKHWRALRRAYPNAPADVRECISRWEADEEPGYVPVLDCLLSSLHTLHKLMRIAYEEQETKLVLLLERERESTDAQAAVALEHADRRQAEREAARD